MRGWYGQRERTVEVVSAPCVWYPTGMPAVPMRWVLIRAPEGTFDTQALLCTTLEVTPRQVREWFVLRGQVEGTFAAARAHLGLETQRPWSAQAVARTTPCVLGLYSLVILLAERLCMQHALTMRRDAWSAKEKVLFSDTLAMVRRWR